MKLTQMVIKLLFHGITNMPATAPIKEERGMITGKGLLLRIINIIGDIIAA